jgi:trans-aconitate 2-methyltransferase
MDSWDPAQYAKFQREREQPFADLMALIEPAPDMRIVDLGCGTGNLTRRLHEALHARETIGIDRSRRMLEAATRDPLPPGLRFETGTVEDFSARESFDLIFSNAVFHWIEDHERLIPRLASALEPGGQLVFQMPAMHDTPSHSLPDELTEAPRFRAAFNGWRRPQPVLEPDDYARVLFRAGFPEPKVRLVIYPHVLASRDEVVEWMKGTLLTEYEKRLSPELYVEFVEAFRQRLLPRLADERPFLFPFKRILCWGKRAAQSA